MREPRWLPRLVLESAHFDQLREHGGLSGLRDADAFEAALARARQKWACEPASDLSSLASAYAFGLANGHPFHDGNKRAAFLGMAIFLGLNKKDLDATEVEVVQIMTALAAGTFSEVELATWVRARLIRLAL